jgi:hypothetical protein
MKASSSFSTLFARVGGNLQLLERSRLRVHAHANGSRSSENQSILITTSQAEDQLAFSMQETTGPALATKLVAK